MSLGRGGRGGRGVRPGQATASAVAGALYERYGARVHRFCARRLGEDEAPDAVQDTFLRVWLALRDGVEIRHPLPWLLTIADNVCVSRFRAQGARIVTTELLESAGAEPSPSPGEVEDLTAALRGLPDTQRQALLRRELQGLSYDEIGAELGVSRASVAALLHRARRAVAESLRGARRGLPAFAPIPAVFRAVHMGNAAGVAVAGSTAATAVAVAQLAGPAPATVPETPQPQAARIEVAFAPRSTGQATRMVLSGGVHHVGKRVASAATQQRAPHHPPEALSKGEPEVLVLQHPLPRTGPDLPTPPPMEAPSTDTTPMEAPSTDTTPVEAPSTDTTPVSPPETTPEVDEPDLAADEAEEADTGEADQWAGGSTGAAPEHGGSREHSDAAPGHDGQPPGIAGSGPPGGGSGGSGDGQGNGGAAGPPHPSHADESGGNGQPSPAGDGTPRGESPPVGGSEPGGQPENGNGPGPPHGGGSGGGPPHGSKP